MIRPVGARIDQRLHASGSRSAQRQHSSRCTAHPCPPPFDDDASPGALVWAVRRARPACDFRRLVAARAAQRSSAVLREPIFSSPIATLCARSRRDRVPAERRDASSIPSSPPAPLRCAPRTTGLVEHLDELLSASVICLGRSNAARRSPRARRGDSTSSSSSQAPRRRVAGRASLPRRYFGMLRNRTAVRAPACYRCVAARCCNRRALLPSTGAARSPRAPRRFGVAVQPVALQRHLRVFHELAEYVAGDGGLGVALSWASASATGAAGGASPFPGRAGRRGHLLRASAPPRSPAAGDRSGRARRRW